jgi:hypothetical protein
MPHHIFEAIKRLVSGFELKPSASKLISYAVVMICLLKFETKSSKDQAIKFKNGTES